MGNYATATDVEVLTQQFSPIATFDTSTKPTLAQVNQEIDDIEYEINNAIEQSDASFATPATDSEDIAILKRYAVYAVACFAYSTHYPQQREQPLVVRRWCERYDKFIKDLMAGRFKLPSQKTRQTGQRRMTVWRPGWGPSDD